MIFFEKYQYIGILFNVMDIKRLIVYICGGIIKLKGKKYVYSMECEDLLQTGKLKIFKG